MRHRIIALAVLVFMLSFALVPYSDSFWQRQAQQTDMTGVFWYDAGLVSSAPLAPNAYLVVTWVQNQYGDIATALLNLVFLVAALWRWLSLDLPGSRYSALLFVFSPLFFASFGGLSDWGLYIFFIIATVWCLMHNWWLPAGLLSVLIGLRSWVDCVIIAIVVLMTAIVGREQRKGFWYLIPLVVVAVFHALFVPVRIDITRDTLLNELFFAFGAKVGVTVLLLLLALVGTIVLWRSRSAFSIAVVAFVSFFVLSVIDARAVGYFSLCAIALAGVAVEALVRRRWALRRLKVVFLSVIAIVVVIGALQAALPQSSESQSEVVDALKWLALQPDGVVFTHFSYGNDVALYSGKRVLLIPQTERVRGARDVSLDSLQLLYAFEQDVSMRLLSKYDVRYVMITEEMTSGLVWEEPGRGLDFAIASNDKFTLLYENEQVRIFGKKNVGS